MLFHFLRPYFLLGLIPTCFLMWCVWKQRMTNGSWASICDPSLLQALIKQQPRTQSTKFLIWLLLFSLCLLWIAASGPAWKKMPMPLYSESIPKMIVLDISKSMLAGDLPPDRLQRAKFVIQDLLQTPQVTPIGFIAYTQEPFTVSPLTEDTQTISALLPSLDSDTAPVGGQNLSLALKQASEIIQQAHFKYGAILVLTGTLPDTSAISQAEQLSQLGFRVSILPIVHSSQTKTAFKAFVQAGGGQLLSLSDSESLKNWIHHANQGTSELRTQLKKIPLWQDEGRWFIIPALLLILPLFQRGRFWSMLG
jgi:Ca-activated chloride channel homolog